MNEKRDLLRDKALTDKATPGPWTYYQRGCDELGYDLDEPPNGPPNGIRGYFQRAEDAEMIAESCVGWPHAIDRAIAAEAENARLRESCTYRLADDDANAWECSACGELWCLDTGTPRENNMHYCPYCGRRITEEAETP